MSDLPKAILYSPIERAWSWIGYTFKTAAQIGVVFMFSTCGYALSQAGCRNDAITYAHALNPEAKCNAIHTCPALCNNETDVAICRFPNGVFQCRAQWGSFSESAKCDLVGGQ